MISLLFSSTGGSLDPENGRKRRMTAAERFRFFLLFLAAVTVSLLAAVIMLPFIIYGLLRELFRRF